MKARGFAVLFAVLWLLTAAGWAGTYVFMRGRIEEIEQQTEVARSKYRQAARERERRMMETLYKLAPTKRERHLLTTLKNQVEKEQGGPERPPPAAREKTVRD